MNQCPHQTTSRSRMVRSHQSSGIRRWCSHGAGEWNACISFSPVSFAMSISLAMNISICRGKPKPMPKPLDGFSPMSNDQWSELLELVQYGQKAGFKFIWIDCELPGPRLVFKHVHDIPSSINSRVLCHSVCRQSDGRGAEEQALLCSICSHGCHPNLLLYRCHSKQRTRHHQAASCIIFKGPLGSLHLLISGCSHGQDYG